MNRARPITIVLRALFFSLLLTFAAGLVSAQNRAKDLPAVVSAVSAARGRAAQPTAPRVHAGSQTAIPSSVTVRKWNHGRAAGDTNVVRQTTLLTRQDPTQQTSNIPAPAQSQHPWWTSDEKYIFFDSDRVSASDTTERVDRVFNIFRMFADGSGVTQITTGNDQKLDPSISFNGGRLAYVAGGQITPPNSAANAVTSGFSLYFLDLVAGTQPIRLTGVTGPAFTDVRHPTWNPGGTQIVFTAQVGVGQPYHLYIVDTNSGVTTQVTNGASNDYSPAWSPDGNLIAFTSNAHDFSPTYPIQAVGGALNSTVNIWVVSPSVIRPAPQPITGAGTASNNKNPVWSSLRTEPLGVIPNEVDGSGATISGRQMIAFASDRNSGGNGTFDIFFLHTSVRQRVPPDPLSGAWYVSTPETPSTPGSPGNPPILLQTSTPGTGIDPTEPTVSFDPNHISNEDFPAWPQYISSYRIAFQSDRKTPTPNGINMSINIWASTILDINAPTLLMYDIPSREIVHVASDNSPEIAKREFVAGETIRFRVKAADYETGVESVWIQIKNPNSKPQSADGLEHKFYVLAGGGLDATHTLQTQGALGVPFEVDCQAINPNINQHNPNNPNPNPSNTLMFRQNGYVPPAFGGPGTIPPLFPGWNRYVSGTDDANAFSGGANPPDADFWLRLYDDGAYDDPDPTKRGHEPHGEHANDGVYTNVWQTPVNLPSDWYLDVIVRDRALDPFTGGSTNWKIYDNVWGFTTQPWIGTGGILYVNDYDVGQKFFQAHSGAFTTALEPGIFSGIPTESWMTEVDGALLPTFAVDTTGHIFSVENNLTDFGRMSYADALTSDGTSTPVTGTYSQWRILSRGPIPDSVLQSYSGHIEVQPPDYIANGVDSRPVVVAERCVVWHSPYSGDLFVGPGTILDPDTQNRIRNFIRNGGRLFLDGQDLGWGITLAGTLASSTFLSDLFKVTYVSDFAVPVMPQLQMNLTAGRGTHPISTETWFLPTFHNYPPIVPPDTPPSSKAVYLTPGILPPNPRSYGCANQFTEDVFTFAPTGTRGFPNWDVDAVYSAPANPSVMWYTDPVAHSKVVFSSFGWEAINPEYYILPGNITIRLQNRRQEMMHNVSDHLRTGRLVGQVKSVSGGGPLGRVFIRAINLQGQTIATTLSQNDGSYVLSGLDATGIIAVEAAKPGFLVQHLEGTEFHGGYQARLDIFLSPAQDGSITGTITRVTDGAPVPGVLVRAYDRISNVSYYGTTQTDGTYVIKNVPAGTYVIVVANLQGNPPPASEGGPPPNGTPTVPFASSNPTAYDSASTDPNAKQSVIVAPGATVPKNDFTLNPLPGSISGIVTDANTNKGIAGATIVATSGMRTYTATSAADGTYSIPNVPPGSYGVVASAPGYLASNSIAATVTSAANTPNVNFALQVAPPGVISGLVSTTTSGNIVPISGATVTVTNAAGQTIATATTGNVQTQGNYQFNYKITNVPSGATVNVSASKPGFSPPTGTTGVVAVTVNPVPPGPENTNVNFTLNPLFTFTNTPTLVSAPYDYSGTNVADLLNIPLADRANGAFQFVTWTGTKYLFYPTPPTPGAPPPLDRIGADTFRLGVGYFLSENNQGVTLALTTPGTPAPNAPFTIKLQPGWNLIGDPFPFPIDFQRLHVQQLDANGNVTRDTDVVSAQSGSNPFLGAALWTYNTGSYQIAYTLDPWRGYWLRAFSSAKLIVDPALRQDRSVSLGTHRTRAASDFSNAAGVGWKFHLTANAGDLKSAPAAIGLHRAASDGYDAFKLEAPPLLGKQNVTMTVNHSDWGPDKSGNYSEDVRSAASPTQSWNFDVTSNVSNVPVTLNWPDIATVPGKQDLILTDLDTQVTTDLRARGGLTIPATSTGVTRHFRLDVKRAGRQMLEITSMTAQINGGRSVNDPPTSVHIAFGLSQDATVQVSILQNGRKIRVVEPNRSRAAGTADEMWDLRKEGGARVSAGLYNVEVLAVDKQGHTVRSIAPVLLTR